jgi:tyrosyl-tRNA synthetase
VQVGGSDQWGNIVAGVDLVRRKEQKIVHAITIPLVVDKATGKKFGKSEGNAVWLDAEKTSPYNFYQFWLNTSDENVIDYLKLFTFLSLEEVAKLELDLVSNPGARAAQRQLAFAVTEFVHGTQVTESVARITRILFGGEVQSLSQDETSMLLANAPTYELIAPQSIIEVLMASGLATSKREARTFIESGAVTLREGKVENSDVVIELEPGEIAILRRGKKNYIVLCTA